MFISRWLSALAVVAVVGAGSPLLGTPASAASCESEAADVAAAAMMAQRCDSRVEVLSKRTPTVQEFINSDGTGVIEIAAYPQRARGKDGAWSTLSYQALPAGSWTMINNQFPNQSYWNFDRTNCPAFYPAGTNCAKVGRAWGTSMVYRSLFQFDTTSLVGKQVLPGAVFSIDLLHSALCGSSNWTNLHRVNSTIGSGTTWNNNVGAWQGVPTASHQSEACNQQRRYTEFGGGSLLGELQQIADSAWPWATWGLRAQVETDANDWKKYDALTALLIVPVNIP